MRDSDPFADGDGPSRAEVQRRIDSLYDRAETDSRTFNATRAMALGAPSSGAPAARPSSGRGRGGSDPALDSVTRRWFDAARGSIGPTVAAALPPDLLPGRSPGALPGRPAEPDYSATIRELEAAARPVLELTAGPDPAPPALPPAERTAVLPELTAAPTELLPPAAEPVGQAAQFPPSPLDSAPGTVSMSGIPAQPTATWPVVAQPPVTPSPTPMAAPPAASPTPVPGAMSGPMSASPQAPSMSGPMSAPPQAPSMPWAAAALATRQSPASPAQPDRSWMGPAKQRNRLKLTAARQLLARNTARLAPQTPAVPAVPAAPAPMAPQAQPAWPTAPDPAPRLPEDQWLPQQPDGYGTAVYTAPAPTAAPGAATGSIPTPPTAAAPAPAVQPPIPAGPGKAAAALDFVRAQLGRPCLWGAAGPEAYDCGGLTQAAWRAAGVELPRTAQEQASTGTTIDLTDLQPGDLLFFHDGPSHVGLVTGNGLMIHAPGPGASVREESVFFAGPQAIQGATRPA